MADEIDRAQAKAEVVEGYAMAAARARAAQPLDPGVEGDCDFCGEWSGRLIGGACAPCRDKRKLP